MTVPRQSAAPESERLASASPEAAAAVLGAFQVETTDIGPQALVTGVAPITPRERLAWRANAPMEPKKPQRPPDHGLFDTNARNQLEMFR